MTAARDHVDIWITALLYGLLVLMLVAIGVADLRDQHRCEVTGGNVVETKHGWRCVQERGR